LRGVQQNAFMLPGNYSQSSGDKNGT
jgi:hypothetical protein